MESTVVSKLKNSFLRTGYVSELEVYEGRFNEKINENPYVSYVVNFQNKRKDTKLHELERRIRDGFYDGHYKNCNILTCIEEISEKEERHKLIMDFNSNLPNTRKRRELFRAVSHLIKIIEEGHYRS